MSVLPVRCLDPRRIRTKRYFAGIYIHVSNGSQSVKSAYVNDDGGGDEETWQGEAIRHLLQKYTSRAKRR